MVGWESFGEGWVTDAVKQLKLDATTLKAGYGELPDLNAIDQDTDVVFTWNGTTSGERVPDGDWIRDDRKGLMIDDSTSAVVAMDLPWEQRDVVSLDRKSVLWGQSVQVRGDRGGRSII